MKRARCRRLGLWYAALSTLAAFRRVVHRSRDGVFGGLVAGERLYEGDEATGEWPCLEVLFDGVMY